MRLVAKLVKHFIISTNELQKIFPTTSSATFAEIELLRISLGSEKLKRSYLKDTCEATQA